MIPPVRAPPRLHGGPGAGPRAASRGSAGPSHTSRCSLEPWGRGRGHAAGPRGGRVWRTPALTRDPPCCGSGPTPARWGRLGRTSRGQEPGVPCPGQRGSETPHPRVRLCWRSFPQGRAVNRTESSAHFCGFFPSCRPSALKAGPLCRLGPPAQSVLRSPRCSQGSLLPGRASVSLAVVTLRAQAPGTVTTPSQVLVAVGKHPLFSDQYLQPGPSSCHTRDIFHRPDGAHGDSSVPGCHEPAGRGSHTVPRWPQAVDAAPSLLFLRTGTEPCVRPRPS